MDELVASEINFVLSITGLDDTSAQTVHARNTFAAQRRAPGPRIRRHSQPRRGRHASCRLRAHPRHAAGASARVGRTSRVVVDARASLTTSERQVAATGWTEWRSSPARRGPIAAADAANRARLARAARRTRRPPRRRRRGRLGQGARAPRRRAASCWRASASRGCSIPARRSSRSARWPPSACTRATCTAPG